MNYIEIEINEKPVGLKFGFEQAKKFAIALAENAEAYYDVNENMTNMGIAKLIHTAYINNCYVKEVKPELTLEYFNDYLEENAGIEEVDKKLGEIVLMWSTSRGTKIALEAIKKNTQSILETLHQKKPKQSTKSSRQRSTQTESEGGS